MEGLTTLLSAISDLCTPILEFILWMCPKIYRLDDGDRGVITTFGCVRKWRSSEVGKGIHFLFMCEEMTVIQAIGGYIDLDEQGIMTKDKKIFIINGAVEYSIFNVKQAVLETENIEYFIQGVVMNEIREYARQKHSEELLDSDKLTQGLTTKINRRIKIHGSKIDRVMITDLRPHEVTLVCETLKELLGGE